MLPPLCLTMPYTVDRPRPVPLPGSLVVKNGSNARAIVASSIPTPSSLTATMTWGPSTDPGCTATYSASISTLAVSMVRLPPLRHGISGVDSEVHDDLLDLARIGL